MSNLWVHSQKQEILMIIICNNISHGKISRKAFLNPSVADLMLDSAFFIQCILGKHNLGGEGLAAF